MPQMANSGGPVPHHTQDDDMGTCTANTNGKYTTSQPQKVHGGGGGGGGRGGYSTMKTPQYTRPIGCVQHARVSVSSIAGVTMAMPRLVQTAINVEYIWGVNGTWEGMYVYACSP